MLGRPANAERFYTLCRSQPGIGYDHTRLQNTSTTCLYWAVERILGYFGLGPFLAVPQG